MPVVMSLIASTETVKVGLEALAVVENHTVEAESAWRVRW